MIYLAGPYTSETFEQHKFNIGRLLTYYTWYQVYKEEAVICPPLESAGFDKKPKGFKEVDWVGKCVELVGLSNAIYLTPGWVDSYGCNCEHAKASELGIEILELAELSPIPYHLLNHYLSEIREYNPLADFALEYMDRISFKSDF